MTQFLEQGSLPHGFFCTNGIIFLLKYTGYSLRLRAVLHSGSPERSDQSRKVIFVVSSPRILASPGPTSHCERIRQALEYSQITRFALSEGHFNVIQTTNLKLLARKKLNSFDVCIYCHFLWQRTPTCPAVEYPRVVPFKVRGPASTSKVTYRSTPQPHL
jgi:hypothetical protein